MEIKILGFKKYVSGKLRGYIDVQIVDLGLTIQGCKLFRNDKGSWVSLPEEKYTDREGTCRWQPFLKFTSNMDKEFQHEVKGTLKKYLETVPDRQPDLLEESQAPDSQPYDIPF